MSRKQSLPKQSYLGLICVCNTHSRVCTCGHFSWDQALRLSRDRCRSFLLSHLDSLSFYDFDPAGLKLKLLALNIPERAGKDFYVCFRNCLNFFLHPLSLSIVSTPTPTPASVNLWIECRALCMLDKRSVTELTLALSLCGVLNCGVPWCFPPAPILF